MLVSGIQQSDLVVHMHIYTFTYICIGTWNVRFLNQGKLEVVELEIARVNIDILGISKLKWTGMGELTEMTIISTIVGKNLLEEMK